MAQYILSVGVDVGVVTTGISICLEGPDELAVPPSDVLLGSPAADLQSTVLGGSGSGSDDELGWGDAVAADDPARLALLKLALLHLDTIRSANPEYPAHIAAVMEEMDRIGSAGKTGPGAVAEYVGHLRAGLIAHLKDVMAAAGLRPADVSLRFVFGIPAVWGGDAVARMREAVEASGILMLDHHGCPAPMDFIAEPEAAALALVPEIARSHALQAGNTVIICDCGGGTVDVITYEIASLSPLSLEECVPGNGKLLGDMFMRSALVHLIKRRVASCCDSPDGRVDQRWLDGEIERVWNAVLQALGTHLTHPLWRHPVEVKYLDGRHSTTVILPGADIVEALRTVTDGILGLVQAQADQVEQVKGCAPNLLVVAGGFGCSKFLQGELRRQFRGKIKMACTERRGYLAVKEGAAIAGLNGSFHALTSRPSSRGLRQPQVSPWAIVQVRSRVARFSCGFWDGTGPRNQLTWFITKGSKIPADISAATFSFPRAGFVAGPNNSVELLVYRTLERRAGVSAVGGTRDDVHMLCRIRCTSRDHLAQGQGQGQEASVRLGVLLKSHAEGLRLVSADAEDEAQGAFLLVL